MNIIRTPLARLALGLTLLSPVATQAQDAGTVLATVGEEEITLGHLIAVAESLPSQLQQLADDQLFSGLLEQIVRQAAIAQSLGDELPKRLQLSLESQRWALLANSVIDSGMNAAVTDGAVQAAYDAKYGPKREYNASHILVETEQEAQALVTQLEGGAAFAGLARARSTGPTGPNGGALGWFGKGMMVAPFEAAVLALVPGGFSNPVQTQFGWHVIRLNAVRDSAAPSLQTVRGVLEEQLREQAAQEIVDSLVGAADISRSDAKIDPALIRDASLLD